MNPKFFHPALEQKIINKYLYNIIFELPGFVKLPRAGQVQYLDGNSVN